MTRHVLVTRPAPQAEHLAQALRARGVAATCVPTVAIDVDSAATELESALRGLDGASWLVVTSANGAEALGRRLDEGGHRLPSSVRVAAVGSATAEALQSVGVPVDHVPGEYLTAEIAGGLGDIAGRRVVLARADAATAELRDALLSRHATVEEVVAYRTVEGPADSRDALHAALGMELDGVAFTSASTVRGLLRLASPVARHRARALRAFCIGPVTAAAARDHGFDVAAVAAPHTADDLADAIAAHFEAADA